MTYIDYLNKFHRWADGHYLPANSKLLYLCLLDIFNRSMWPECVQIDNMRLAGLAGVSTEKSAIRARDALIEAGLISYQKGKKGIPGKYSLRQIHCNNYSKNDSEYDSISDSETGSENFPCKIYSESDSVFDSENDTLYDGKNDSHIKNKNKNIDKDIDHPRYDYDDGFASVMKLYMDKISPMPSQTSIDELKGYMEKMDAECCIEAINIALDSGARNWKFIRSVLQNKLNQGVRSIEDWKRAEADFQQRKAQQTGGGRGYQQKQDEPWSYPEYTKEELEAMGSL